MRAVLHCIGLPFTYAMVGLIKLYQLLISPLLGPKCRFHPSCSVYGVDALTTHGAVKGPLLTIRRVCRCHPWQLGGLDPVPPKGKWLPEIDLDGNPRTPLRTSPPSPDLRSI